jgi:hypothetical protein
MKLTGTPRVSIAERRRTSQSVSRTQPWRDGPSQMTAPFQPARGAYLIGA